MAAELPVSHEWIDKKTPPQQHGITKTFPILLCDFAPYSLHISKCPSFPNISQIND